MKRCLSFEQFPINIGDMFILFIEETSSIIYKNSSNSAQYSAMDQQGRIIYTYNLSSFQQTTNSFIAYFFIDSKLYLTQLGQNTQFVIDLAMLEQNTYGFISQNSFPALKFPCRSYQVVKIRQIFYLMCAGSNNIQNNYIVSSPTFQELFVSNNITRITQNLANSLIYCNSKYFIIMGDLMLLEDGNFDKIDKQNQYSNIQLLSKKWSIYVISRIQINKLQVSNTLIKILQQITLQSQGSIGIFYSDIIDFQNLNSIQLILSFIPGCSEYLDSTKQTCKVCNSYYQLSNGICVVTCGQGFFEREGICIQYGLFFHQDKLCKVCDTNNGYTIDGQNCICQDGYTLDNQKGFQQYLSYKSTTFSQNAVNQATQYAQTSSKAAFASITFLSSVQNLNSASSIGISIYGITCFKLSYLLLVNTTLPQQRYAPLSAIKDQFPSHQFQKLNLFALVNQDNCEFQNLRYEQLDISYDMLQTTCDSNVYDWNQLANQIILVQLWQQQDRNTNYFTFIFSTDNCFNTLLLVLISQQSFIQRQNLQFLRNNYRENIK
ncbi:hypothetical protein ABPG72_003843 [Tetrahymena utriculariae]